MYSIETTSKKIGLSIPTIYAHIKAKKLIGEHFKKNEMGKWVIEKSIVDRLAEVK